MAIRIQPSILAADFLNLESQFQAISTADAIHVDVMDGHFVPNLTFGLPVVKQMQSLNILPLDVHLMIENVDSLAKEYAKLGVFSVTVHLEACKSVSSTLESIRAEGVRVGLAIKPSTPLEMITPYLEYIDQILVMSVEPGFGGQSFIEGSLERIEEVRKRLDDSGSTVWLQVDGGINALNIEAISRAGADTFVAGSAVFDGRSPKDNIANLRQLAYSGAKSNQTRR